MPVDRREREKQKRRYADAKESAAKSKGGFDNPTINVPKDMQVFKFKRAGIFRINVMPFVTKQGNQNADEGILYYERTFWIHTSVGAEEKSYCCPLKNGWAQSCCICDKAAQLRQQGKDDDAIGPFKPKRRQVWLFDDVTDVKDPKNHKPNPQLFEAAYYGGRGYKGFGEMMDGKITLADPGDPATRFHRLDSKGMTLRINAVEATFKGNKYFHADEIDFVDRKEVYDEDLEMPCLDDVPRRITSKDLRKIFLQEVESDTSPEPAAPAPGKEEEEENEENDRPSRRNGEASSTPKEEEEEEEEKEPVASDKDNDDEGEITAGDRGITKGCMIVHKKYGKCEVIKIYDDDTKLSIKDEEDDVYKEIPPAQCTVIDKEEEEEEEEEERRPAPSKKPSAKEEKDEVDEWDDEE